MKESALHFDISDYGLIAKHERSTRLLKSIFVFCVMAMMLVGYLSASYKINSSVQGTGVIEPINRYAVRAGVAGIIQHFHCAENEMVQAGSVVAQILDPQWQQGIERFTKEIHINESRRRELLLKINQEDMEYQFMLGQAALGLEELRVRYDQVLAEQRLYEDSNARRKPIDELFPVKSIKAVLNDKLAHLNLIKRRGNKIAVYQQEIATIDRVRQKLEKEIDIIHSERQRGLVRTPFNGRVVTGSLARKLGQRVSAGEEVLEIIDTANWVGKIHISENDRPKVELGLPARVFINAFPHAEHKVFGGTVTRIDHTPVLSPSVAPGVAYPVVVQVLDPWAVDAEHRLSLAAGMSIDVKIIVAEETIYQMVKRTMLAAAGKIKQASPLMLQE